MALGNIDFGANPLRVGLIQALGCQKRMSQTQTSFDPLNDLESALLQAQAGQLAAPLFLDKLMHSQVFVLIDKDPGPSGWDKTATPLVLSNSAGSPVLALFTAPERSDGWPARVPQFSYGLLTDFRWLVRGIASGVGIVLNPGHPVGLELSADRVSAMTIDAGAQ